MLALWRRLLAPGGALDRRRRDPAACRAAERRPRAAALCAANGFLGAALVGLARTALSRYRRLRNELGIARYSEAEFLDRLRAAGSPASGCRAMSSTIRRA